jgi:hypothetical protein
VIDAKTRNHYLQHVPHAGRVTLKVTNQPTHEPAHVSECRNHYLAHVPHAGKVTLKLQTNQPTHEPDHGLGWWQTADPDGMMCLFSLLAFLATADPMGWLMCLLLLVLCLHRWSSVGCVTG